MSVFVIRPRSFATGAPFTNVMTLQLFLGGMNFLLFVVTGAWCFAFAPPGLIFLLQARAAQITVISIMSVILWDLGRASALVHLGMQPSSVAKSKCGFQAVHITNDLVATHPRTRQFVACLSTWGLCSACKLLASVEV